MSIDSVDRKVLVDLEIAKSNNTLEDCELMVSKVTMTVSTMSKLMTYSLA
jgi:hypothetical protein